MTANLHSIYSKSLSQLKELLSKEGLRESAAVNIFEILYKKRDGLFSRERGISKDLQSYLEKTFDFSLPKIVTIQNADDQTTKFLMEMSDGKRVETVLIPFNKKFTVCLSSQVGCAMKCSFCFTGTQGLSRNLETKEILGQYIQAWNWLKENHPNKAVSPNIVFMGQGEPLHNFDEVKKTVEILLEPNGAHLGPRQITLSSAGYLPGLERFSEFPRINLALSLHSPFDKIRNELIPLNKAYNIEKIFEALDKIPLLKRQFINFEYLLIDQLNDDDKSIEELGKLLSNRRAIVNIIPFNEFPGSIYKRPSLKKVDLFKEKLSEFGIHTMVRTTKGDDILAACGQLKVEHD